MRHAFGKTLLGTFGPLEFVGGAEPAAATVARQFVLVALATLPLALLLSAHRKRLLDLTRTPGGWRRGIRRLLFKLLDPLLGRFKFLPGRLELPLQHPNDVDQPTNVDPPLANVLLELLDGIHASNL
jgi:hypothetical protein